MKQYGQIKAKYPDAILLFRVGDFYETFGEDAIKTANILGIVLTNRNNGGSKIELAGFPHHSLDLYLPKLIRAGFRVAICDQLEKPSKEKKIVKRGVTELVTPGIAVDEKLLENHTNNFLASIYKDKELFGIAFLDISTGEFYLAEGNRSHIDKLLESFAPSEVIYSKEFKHEIHEWLGDEYYTYGIDEWAYTSEYTRKKLLDHFKTINLKGFGVEDALVGQIAAGAVIHYLESTQHHDSSHIYKIQRIREDHSVWLDRFTMRNLELLYSNHPTGIALLDVMDKCKSPMGSRLMKKWIAMPLTDKITIEKRLDAVTALREKEKVRIGVNEYLKCLGDFERLASRIASYKINPREVNQLKSALSSLPEIITLIKDLKSDLIEGIRDQINPCPDLVQRISEQLQEEAPAQVNKGNIIATGFNKELDDLRYIIENNQSILLEIQQKEAKNTGITNLKLGFNNVFGYYLEVTNKYKNQGLIPDNWIRKQTLTNSERYITSELKDIEDKILGAEDKILELEEKLYRDLVEHLQKYLETILSNANLIAQLDCLISFAEISLLNQYNRPEIEENLIIDIKEGRHPVIEHQLPAGENYIANDLYLNNDDQQIIMITGPNMSGKSAILRQTALICLMAQMGSYIPAKSASIGIVDKVFTRVGASDNLSKGESTFMVEMIEAANIINNLSSKSLILLDEIGRGTSTYDGISIAWAISEYLHENNIAKPKTLFATHYHELNQLEDMYPRIKNYHVSTREINDKIIFLRKLKPGGSEHSFGIHVAQMAGLPKEIINRAQAILGKMEENQLTGKESKNPKNLSSIKKASADNFQLQIFDLKDESAMRIKESLVQLDINSLSPIESLLKIKELKEMIDN
ncbi:DNA mismatch repair protein MutS [Membranihabitans maritimus]|uniref:DNA mismatch repair protein MutS n=1 Tax=Membranihabitans maritimus TaxID=2904244 RepID=UPI001F0096BB|nr:DNA mismatch repair protein MutS [Membranihabitans maritimus]